MWVPKNPGLMIKRRWCPVRKDVREIVRSSSQGKPCSLMVCPYNDATSTGVAGLDRGTLEYEYPAHHLNRSYPPGPLREVACEVFPLLGVPRGFRQGCPKFGPFAPAVPNLEPPGQGRKPPVLVSPVLKQHPRGLKYAREPNFRRLLAPPC